MKEIVGKSVLILGYGLEGQSVHRWLKKFYPKAKIKIIRTLLGVRQGESWIDCDTIVKSPGIPADSPALLAAAPAKGWSAFGGGKHITSLTNIFFSICPGKIIAVTGTKGKSTTASLIHAILSRIYPDVRLVGNIGNPSLDYLEGANQKTLFVIELSSYQLEDIRYGPFVAVILDIVPEHLDRYQNFENYVAAKERIVKFQTPKDYVVFNPDHKIPADIASQSLANKCQTFASQQMSDICKELPLLGEGNRENCLAAVTVAKILGVPYPAIRQAVKSFKPLPHRLERIGEFRRVTFYDDSISTIPQSAIHALEALGDKVETLIAGGFDRGLDYTELGKFLVNRKGLKNIILFPDTGAKIWQAILAAAGNQPLHLMKFNVSSMKQAMEIAFAKTAKEKICLLSPAAASYNLFKNFEDRGDEFKNQISIQGRSLKDTP